MSAPANAAPVLPASVLDRIAVDRDGRRIAFYEDSRGTLANAWTKARKYGWLRQLVADAILSGRPLSIIDLQSRTCVAPFDGTAYPFHVAVEVRS